jgi:alkaline phosphatase D
MRKKQGDFMLWLGDNVYMWKKHYSSFDGMFNRYMNTRRRFKSVNNFIGNQPHYAIWDDHDYGPNDACGDFGLKDSSLKIFKGFWPNTYPEAEAFNGNYFKFSRYDADFFMMDNRSCRGRRGDTSGPFLGPTQMLWLKQQLLTSEASFKFITIGSQVVSRMGFGEKYNEYSQERNELFDFIVEKNIKGVIFLTGDMHFTELCKEEWKGYPLYDYSCSPLTSPPLPVSILSINKNPLRVKGTKFAFRNFGRVSVSGEAGNRICTLETFDRRGKRQWKYQIAQSELKVGGVR